MEAKEGDKAITWFFKGTVTKSWSGEKVTGWTVLRQKNFC
jgi:hypothetical protein